MLARLSALFASAWRLLFGVAKKVREHDKKVTETRYCKICGRLAEFCVRTGFRDMTPVEMSCPASEVLRLAGGKAGVDEGVYLPLAHNPTFRVCQEHHPDIGRKRAETREYMFKINPKLAVRLIEPTQIL